MSNDYFKSKGWLTNYAQAEDSTGMWQNYVKETEDRDARIMDQEPRNMYNQGSSVDHAVRTIDPIQDSGNKIEEVLKAYGIYQGNRKGGRMSFSKFFELFSRENFKKGGMIGKPGGLVEEGVTKYGVTATDSKKYQVDAERKGVKFRAWNNGKVLFETKELAEEALAKFNKENPTFSELKEYSSAQEEFYKIKPEQEGRYKILNQYTQEQHNLDYKELLKKDADEARRIYKTANNNKFKFVSQDVENAKSPLSAENKTKLLKAYPELKDTFDFDKHPKYGVPHKIGDKINPNYTSIVDFKRRGYKRFTRDFLSPADIKKIKNAHELPLGEKWNFLSEKNPTGFKWGIDAKKNQPDYKKYQNLQKRIQATLRKKTRSVASDFSTPRGWMTGAMERVYKNQTEIVDGVRVPKKGMKLTYEPIFNEDNIITGFIDNTPAGKGNAYYSLKVNAEAADLDPKKPNSTPWKLHGDFDEVSKFVDITKRVKQAPNEIISEILEAKGVKNPQLKLRDILNFETYYKTMDNYSTKTLLNNAVVQHHQGGVGAGNFPRTNATKDLQIIRRIDNQEIIKFDKKLNKTGSLSPEDSLELKKIGASLIGNDGTVYGGGPLTAEEALKGLENKALNIVKNKNFNPEQFNEYLLKLAGTVDPDCRKKAVSGKANGGRIGFSTGGSDTCLITGKETVSKMLTDGSGSPNQRNLIKRIVTGGANFLKQNLSLKELMKLENWIGKPAAYGAAIFDTAMITDDVFRKKLPFNQAAAKTLVFDTLLNLDENVIEAKNILDDPSLSPAAKEYAQNIIDQDTYSKTQLSPVKNKLASVLPGTDNYFKMRETLEDKIKKSSGTGELDYKSALANKQDAFTAKTRTGDAPDKTGAPSFFSGELKKAYGDIEQKPGQLPTTGTKMVPAYVSQNYETMEPGITPKIAYDNFFRKEGMLPKDEQITNKYYQENYAVPEKWQQLIKAPGMLGTQEKFNEGGLAGLIKKYYD